MIELPPYRLGLVVGETSGDLLAAEVLKGLQARFRPQTIEAAGIGGPRLVDAQFDAWWPAQILAVNGYVEALRAYPRLARIRQQLVQRWRARPPDLFLGVDAPDFNLGLEIQLRRAGVRTAHFVSPSIWAWRRERITTIRKAVDHMLLVFPFEQAIYREAGIPATYVGHPLADVIPRYPDRAAARARLLRHAVPSDGDLIAILPGSRVSEIRHIGPVFLSAARRLIRQRPQLRCVLPAATPALHAMLMAELDTVFPANGPERERITLIQGQSHDAMAAALGVLVASGTASLEAALFGRPMVIAYRLHRLNYALMRRRAYLPWIGLPNILAGESLVPELLQDAATPDALADALLQQLDDRSACDRLAQRFGEMHEQLACGCAQRAADLIHDLRR